MAKAKDHDSKDGRQPARPQSSREKAEAMRDAVRQAIESLIEKKGPAKGRPFTR